MINYELFIIFEGYDLNEYLKYIEDSLRYENFICLNKKVYCKCSYKSFKDIPRINRINHPSLYILCCDGCYDDHKKGNLNPFVFCCEICTHLHENRLRQSLKKYDLKVLEVEQF